MVDDAVPGATVGPGWRAFAVLSVWALLIYLTIVLPLDRAVPAINKWYVAGALIVASFITVAVAMRHLLFARATGAETTKNAALLAFMLLFCLLFVDVSFTAYSNFNASFRIDQSRIFQERLYDGQLWDGELMPQLYYPTQANFWVYKPNQIKGGITYGEHYYHSLAQDPTLSKSVLELRRVDFAIDKYGLRNKASPAESAIFALGDSFCFGYHMSQDKTFPELLSAELGQGVYNMGVSGTSPWQQYSLLEYMLQSHAAEFKPKHVIWLIFDGNDLEETYELQRPDPNTDGGLSRIFARTIVGAVADIPQLLRDQSVIRLLSSGNLQLTRGGSGENHNQFDGRPIAVPIYRSERYGYRLFRQVYIERAAQSESYVLSHPHLPRLAATFDKMQALAAEKNFEVTVLLVPSDARFYKDEFEDFPEIPERKYFLDQVAALAQRSGFSTIDLDREMKPYAEHELLHSRDDTHWNERGHEVVAKILATQVFGASGSSVAAEMAAH